MSEVFPQAISDDGITILSDTSDTENQETVQQLQKLIHDAKDIGCIQSLAENNHNVSYLTETKRAKYLDLVNIAPSDHVLEIGGSMGQHTRLIAPLCRAVSSIEVVELQAKFARLWCDQDGLKNVDISAGGASGMLPYADDTFDVVLLNYVLEWCAGRADDNPHEFHRGFIKEIYRVLKPGGRFFISTKNRFALKYVTGSVDEHSGIRFGNALPKWLHKRVRGNRDLGHPAGHLHSWRGLERLLNDVGFNNPKKLFFFPDARFPIYAGTISSFSVNAISKPNRKRLSRKDRATLSLPKFLMVQFSNSIAFLAEK